MSKASLEERVTALEIQMAKLLEQEKTKLPWWHRVKGIYDDTEAFDEAMRLGREYRESLRPGVRKSKRKAKTKRSKDS